jgi:hypothetical protein
LGLQSIGVWICIHALVGLLQLAHAAPAEPAATGAASAAEADMALQKFKRQDVIAADATAYLLKLQAEQSESRHAIAENEARIRDMDSVALWADKGRSLNHELHDRQLPYQALIFLVVVIVVLAGVWFSFLQFTVEQRRRKDLLQMLESLKSLPSDAALHGAAVTAFQAASGAAPHALELGPMKLTSNVIGLIVLAMSLAFFSIFVDRVYTIHALQQPAATVAPADAASSSSNAR